MGKAAMEQLQQQITALQQMVEAQQQHLAQRDGEIRQAREDIIRAAADTRTALDQAAEERRERRAVLDTVANRDIVDTKGVGQPPKFDGTPGGKGSVDFGEWAHKFGIYAQAKFGREVVDIMKWAVLQKFRIVKERPPDAAVARLRGGGAKWPGFGPTGRR